MKKRFVIFILLIILIVMILNPLTILNGAKNGLLLWYNAVLPALLPFMIISGLFINSKIANYLPPKVFCTIAGLFFGCPACSVVCVSFYKKGRISKNSANFLACVFNNLSPSFITGYFCGGLLRNTSYIRPVLLLFYISLLLSTFFLRFTLFRKSFSDNFVPEVIEINQKHVFDFSLMSAINNIVKVGGYIICFSIIASFISYTLPKITSAFMCSIIEVTNGINKLNSLNLSIALKILTALPFITFGGISGLFQVFSLDEESIIDRKKYICSKVVSALICALVVFIAYVLKLIS